MLQHRLVHLAAQFAPVGLDALGDARLMERVDRKFVIPAARIDEILSACRDAYRILDVGGVRLNRYATCYFDTQDFAMYRAHHAERTPRSKVRVREYVDSGMRFMELKRRTNSGRTYKTRVPIEGTSVQALDALRGLTEFTASGLDRNVQLQSVLDVSYVRLTLVRRESAERVTLDVDMMLSHGGRSERFPGVVFAEVKQMRVGPSPCVDALRAARIREGAISKYCIGVASLVDHVRNNRFRRAVAQLRHASAIYDSPLSA